MSKYTLSHLDDAVLERRVERINVHGFRFTAWELAHIAEYDARRLFVPKGYPSMHSYCVGHLHLSADAAYKRIQAGRAARQFPAIFDLIAAGRLHLCGVVELAPYLTPENASELLAASTHRTRAEIQALLVQRFPRPDVPTRLEALGPPAGPGELAPGPVDASSIRGAGSQLAPGPVGSPAPRVTPLSAERYAFQVTIGQGEARGGATGGRRGTGPRGDRAGGGSGEAGGGSRAGAGRARFREGGAISRGGRARGGEGGAGAAAGGRAEPGAKRDPVAAEARMQPRRGAPRGHALREHLRGAPRAAGPRSAPLSHILARSDRKDGGVRPRV